MKAPLVLLLALPLVTAQAQAPTPIRYRLESRDGSERGIPTMFTELVTELVDQGRSDEANRLLEDMRLPPTGTATFVGIISATMKDSAGGKLIHATVDSTWTSLVDDVTTAGIVVPATLKAMLANGVGGTVDVFVVGGVAVRTTMNPEVNLALAQVARFLPLLAPARPLGARPGSRWSDTVTTPTRPREQGIPADFMVRKETQPLITDWHYLSAESIVGMGSGKFSVTIMKDLGETSEIRQQFAFTLDSTSAVQSAKMLSQRFTDDGVGPDSKTRQLTITRLGPSQ